jgi:hypothetical protein
MNPSLPHRLITILAGVISLLAGLILVSASPAQARTTPTDYGFGTSAFGSRVVAGAPGLEAERTAFSYLGCTRMAGKTDSNYVASADVPAVAPRVHLSGIASRSTTFATRSGQVGTMSHDRIAEVVLGEANGQHITIDGLTVRSRAWADKADRLHAANAISSVDIGSNTGTPLDDVLNAADAGIEDLTAAIRENGGSYTIPGLGTLSLGHSTKLVKPGYAKASLELIALRLDPLETRVVIGRSSARIDRGAPAGVMSGAGWGAEVPAVLGGTASTGRLALQPLRCLGTDGDVKRSDLPGLDLGNQGAISLGTLSGFSSGVQKRNGFIQGWTKGQVADANLGDQLALEGIVGKATVTRTETGRLTTSIKGSKILSLTVGGESHEVPDPGESILIGQPGSEIAKVTFFEKSRTKSSIRVTAATIELLNNFQGAPTGTVIRLGNAKTALRELSR